ncbi:MAG: hypothetical protein LBK59_12345, partial [Bifidobacteriaceae bacterium]|nr:hypothetical protein [Bifidobacteriaceae bacterium]
MASAIMAGVCAAGLPAREVLGPLIAIGAAASAGLVDDMAGETDIKGLSGHLRVLAGGKVTTGAAKILLIGAGGLAAATMDACGRVGRRWPAPPWCAAAGIGLDAGMIALSAHVINLCDLRPGRALKAAAPPAAAL